RKRPSESVMPEARGPWVPLAGSGRNSTRASGIGLPSRWTTPDTSTNCRWGLQAVAVRRTRANRRAHGRRRPVIMVGILGEEKPEDSQDATGACPSSTPCSGQSDGFVFGPCAQCLEGDQVQRRGQKAHGAVREDEVDSVRVQTAEGIQPIILP